MKHYLILAACFPLAVSAEQTRSLDAHEHGSGTLDIAVSGSEVAMAFAAPGADIVGFEYQASTAEDRAAVDAAVSDLAHPLKLFKFPEQAGCSVTQANVTLLGGDEAHDHDDHDHEEDHAEEGGHAHDDHNEEHAEHAEHGHDDHDHQEKHAEHDEHGHDDEEHAASGEASHTEFRAEYTLACAEVEKIQKVEFAYFDRFPNALEMDVQIVSDKGAQAHEVERDAPVLDLRGMF